MAEEERILRAESRGCPMICNDCDLPCNLSFAGNRRN